jgi:glycosyltransferase involved in cell wall biosynthesis
MAEAYPGITVLIPTYNRGEVLRKSLEALTQVGRDGLDCTFVIIDNNSNDNTAEVVTTFSSQLPVILLKEPRPGKNCALNRALREIVLKEIVAFIDDDISPAEDWFRQIVAITTNHPEIAVFGGRIELSWPAGEPPEWATADWIKDFAFSFHHYANQETFYKPPACPFGGNLWVRSSVFKKVPFFDESIGPRPTNRVMGSETSFLRELQRQDVRMLYCPSCVVRHRILAKECKLPALRRRGYTFGRGQTRIHGRHRKRLYSRSKALWGATILADYCYTALRYAVGAVHWNMRRRCELTVKAMIRFGRLQGTLSRTREASESNSAVTAVGGAQGKAPLE